MVRITTLGKRWAARAVRTGKGKSSEARRRRTRRAPPPGPSPPRPSSPGLPPDLTGEEGEGRGGLSFPPLSRTVGGEAGREGVGGVRDRAEGPRFAKLTGMDEIRPEKAPGPTPQTEVQAAAQSGEPPRWGKGTETAEDGKFLEGPHSRASEFRRLLRIGADFIRGFRGLHFVGPCVTVFGSARFHEDHPYYALAREIGARLGRAGFTVHDRRRPGHHGGGQPRRPRGRRRRRSAATSSCPRSRSPTPTSTAGSSSATSSSAR